MRRRVGHLYAYRIVGVDGKVDRHIVKSRRKVLQVLSNAHTTVVRCESGLEIDGVK